MTGRSFSRFVL